MAYTYIRSTKANGDGRWMCKIKVGGKLRAVSLGLPAPGNQKVAEARLKALEYEIGRGEFSDETRAWLGQKAYHEIVLQLAGVGKLQHTWQSAADQYLAEMEAEDRHRPPAGKALHRDRTLVNRRYAIQRLVNWLGMQPFMSEPFTVTLQRWVKHMRAEGLSPNTINSSETAYPLSWGQWMHKRGWCEEIDRDKLEIPKKAIPELLLPSLDDEVALLDLLHRGRNGDTADRAAWVFVLLVRGLGCRPSEAQGVDWRTMFLKQEQVQFLATKDGRRKGVPLRTVPVMYEWVRSGLSELWEQRGRPSTGAVSTSAKGRLWSSDSCPNRLLLRITKAANVKHINPKMLQKLAIRQWLQGGLPPWFVAQLTGHDVSVQEQHYCADAWYLPPAIGVSYGRYGVLSEYGRRCFHHAIGLTPTVTRNGDNSGDTQDHPE